MGASRSDIIAFLREDYSVAKKIMADAGSEKKAVQEIIAVQRSLTPEEQLLLPEYLKETIDHGDPNLKPSSLSRIPTETV